VKFTLAWREREVASVSVILRSPTCIPSLLSPPFDIAVMTMSALARSRW
jgi:hypothetical protein